MPGFSFQIQLEGADGIKKTKKEKKTASEYSVELLLCRICKSVLMSLCVYLPHLGRRRDGIPTVLLWIQGGRNKHLAHLIDLVHQQCYWRRD